VPIEPEVVEPVEPTAEAVPIEPEVVEPVEPTAEAVPIEPTANAADAGAEVAAGHACLEADDPMMAALHFGVAIRLAPASARSVLDAIGDRQELPLQLVRGDALRLLGLEGDAGRAYLSVASALGAPKPATPEPTQPEPATDAPAATEPVAAATTEPAVQSTVPVPTASEPASSVPESAPPTPGTRVGTSVEEPPAIRWD
jgi:cell division septation protein DedD